MSPADSPPRSAHGPRCDHCGRPVHGTRHTRTDYRVDHYALHSGHGEIYEIVGDYDHHDTTYVRLVDHYGVVSCAECYPLPAVQEERERRFRPESVASDPAAAGDEAGEA